MAKINFGAVVNDARGKVNGNVFSRNKSGAYVRRKVSPSNPSTVFQAAIRSAFSVNSQAWSSVLTDAQRASWTSFANLYPITNVFGLAIPLNGLNMYVRINTALANIGASLLTDPPASPATTPVPIDTGSLIVSPPGDFTFTQTAIPPTAGTLLYVFATPGLAPGRSAVKNLYKLIGTQTPAPVTVPHTVDVLAQYTARFGVPVLNLRYNLLVSTIDPTVGIPTVGQPLTAIAA